MRRTLVKFTLFVASVIVVVTLVKRFADDYARREITAQLHAAGITLGEIDKLDLGFRQIGARGVTFVDDASGEVWLELDELSTDLTAWNVLRGETSPRHVVLEGVRVALRVNGQGVITTRLPAWPEVQNRQIESLAIRGGEVLLLGDDAELLSAREIEIDATGGQHMVATAKIGEALGSAWELHGELEDGAVLELSTANLTLSGEQLTKLPWLSPRVAGIQRLSTAATISVNVQPQGKSFEVDISLQSLDATVPSAEFEIKDTTARLTIERGSARLHQFEGTFAGGQLSLAGEVLRTGDDYSASLQGTLEGIAMSDLPSNWNLPPRLNGICDGRTELQLNLTNEEFSVAGSVQGTIGEASAAGLRLKPISIGVALEEYRVSSRSSSLSGRVSVGLGATNLEVSEILQKLSTKSHHLAKDARGALSFDVELSAPLNALRDANQYQGSGTLHAARMTIGSLAVDDIRSEVKISNGVLENRLECNVGDGSLEGQFTAGLSGAHQVDASLAFQQVGIAGLGVEGLDQVQGDLAGTITAVGSWNDLLDVATWQAGGTLRSERVQRDATTLSNLAVSMRLRESRLQFDDFRVTWAETRLTGSAAIDLDPKRFRIDLSVDKADIANVAAELKLGTAPPKLGGIASIHAAVFGELAPLSWQAKGEASVSELALSSLEIDHCRLQWSMDKSELRFSRLSARLFDGEIVASAKVPFGGEPIEVTGAFRELESGAMFAVAGNRAQLEGRVSGRFSLSASGFDEVTRGNFELNAPSLSAYGIPATDLAGVLSYADRRIELQLAGNALTGTFEMQATAEAHQADLADLQLHGRIRARQLELAQVQPLVNTPQPTDLAGSVNLDLEVDLGGPSLTPTCHGSCQIENLRWKRFDLVSLASADLAIAPDAIRIRNVSAQLGEGTARGEVTLNKGASGSSFRLTLQRVRARRLLRSWPKAARVADGLLDLQLEGTLDEQWHGSGLVRMPRARLARLTLQKVDVPFQWSFMKNSRRWQFNTRAARAKVARGRITASVNLAQGRRLDLKCQGRVEAINLPSLLRRVPGATPAVDGRLSARFQLEGRDIRSINDLTGRTEAKLVQSRVLMLPIFRHLASSMGLGTLTRKFDITEVEGRLSKGGILRVDRLRMANRDLQMEADGRMWLGGKIDLNVTAHVGDFAVETAIDGVLSSPSRILRAAANADRLLQASEILDNRLLFLHLGGTMRHPTINARQNQYLDRDMLMFFLNQASVHLLN